MLAILYGLIYWVAGVCFSKRDGDKDRFSSLLAEKREGRVVTLHNYHQYSYEYPTAIQVVSRS